MLSTISRVVSCSQNRSTVQSASSRARVVSTSLSLLLASFGVPGGRRFKSHQPDKIPDEGIIYRSLADSKGYLSPTVNTDRFRTHELHTTSTTRGHVNPKKRDATSHTRLRRPQSRASLPPQPS